MGITIQEERFSARNQAGLLKPIIYCCNYKNISEQSFPINKILAESLLFYSPNRRTFHIEKCFADVVSTLPDDCIIKDFDVLFNPAYEIDALRIMVNTCKVKPYSILWPGKFEDDRLIYAEEGYADYKTYSIHDYDVTCII